MLILILTVYGHVLKPAELTRTYTQAGRTNALGEMQLEPMTSIPRDSNEPNKGAIRDCVGSRAVQKKLFFRLVLTWKLEGATPCIHDAIMTKQFRIFYPTTQWTVKILTHTPLFC